MKEVNPLCVRVYVYVLFICMAIFIGHAYIIYHTHIYIYIYIYIYAACVSRDVRFQPGTGAARSRTGTAYR